MDYNIDMTQEQLKLNSTEVNPDTGAMEANITITNDAIIFLQEVVDSFLQGKLGDIDDPSKQEKANQIKSDIHNIWTVLNPS